MPSLTIKNVPEGVYARLKRSAEEHRRSLNSEVIHRLEQAVGLDPVAPESLLAEVRALRESADVPYLTDESLREARDQGRA